MTQQPGLPVDIGAIDPDDPSDDVETLPDPEQPIGDPEGEDPSGETPETDS